MSATRIDGRTGLPSTTELKHNASTYRSGKCKCKICREDHNRKNRERKAALKQEGYVSRSEAEAKRLERAKEFLEDGCSYREAARSAHVGHHLLIEKLPGYENNTTIWNGILTQIKNDETLLRMHREVWQGGQHVHS